MLENHGDRFVCMQFFLARGVRDNGFDVDKEYGMKGQMTNNKIGQN